MKSSKEILNAANSGEEFDVTDVIEEMMSELQKNTTPLPPAAQLLARMNAFDKKINYLGDLILTLAEQVNALPNGIENEAETFVRFLDFCDIEAVYLEVEKRIEAETGLQVVTGEVPPL